MKGLIRFGALASVVLLIVLSSGETARAYTLLPTGAAPQAAAFGRLPLQFERNEGQAAAQVRFLAHGRGFNLSLATDAAVLALSPTTDQTGAPALVRIQFAGADSAPEVEGLGALPGTVNYYVGRDPSRWHSGIATYARVRYRNIYPGIDLAFYGNQQQLEHDFVVAPGADPGRISLSVAGADALALSETGDLVLKTSSGELYLRKPFIYQDVDGVRRPVDGGYTLRGDQIGFQVASYDVTRALVIDPVLVYSSYFGGSGDDYGNAIAVDSTGSVYIAGATNSTDFPLASPAQPAFGGGGVSCPSDQVPNRLCYDAFVTKLNPVGNAVVYSTYLGDQGDDQAYGIAVDAAGNAYVTGQISLNSDALPTYYIYKYIWAAKLNASGALAYSSWFGSNGSLGRAVAVDAAGRAYITGEVDGSDFPTTPDAIQPARGELIDAFVSVLSADGTTLLYSTYLGGSGSYCGACYSSGYAIAVDNTGKIYVAGQAAPSFPTTSNAYSRTFAGFFKAFVVKIDPTLSGAAGLLYSTYLGGKGSEVAKGIGLDGTGKVYATGSTQPDDFPTTPGAYDRTCGTDSLCNATTVVVCDWVPPGMPPNCHVDAKADVFVAKLDLSQSGAGSLLYSTYAGGSGQDVGAAIAVDPGGNVYVVGVTYSPDFPSVNPLQASAGANSDAFVFKLNASGSALVYSTYMAGGGSDEGRAIAVDAAGNAYVTGYTGSAAFPIVSPLRPRSGGMEAFISKISIPSLSPRAFLPVLLK